MSDGDVERGGARYAGRGQRARQWVSYGNSGLPRRDPTGATRSERWAWVRNEEGARGALYRARARAGAVARGQGRAAEAAPAEDT